MDESIKRVVVAAADMESAQFQLDNIAADLKEMVSAALSDGAGAEELAAASGLSAAEIQDIWLNGPAGAEDPDAPLGLDKAERSVARKADPSGGGADQPSR